MALAKRDFLRAAVFLWTTLFFTALSRADMASCKAFRASSTFFSLINFLTSLTALRDLFLLRRLMTRRRKDCRMALAADLVLGMETSKGIKYKVLGTDKV